MGYLFQLFFYMVMANYLVYVTFHMIPYKNPSFPGDDASVRYDGNPKWKALELFDFGFQWTPNWSHRPWWLKMLFLDLNVSVAQGLPPALLFLTGRTRDLVAYTGTV